MHSVAYELTDSIYERIWDGVWISVKDQIQDKIWLQLAEQHGN